MGQKPVWEALQLEQGQTWRHQRVSDLKVGGLTHCGEAAMDVERGRQTVQESGWEGLRAVCQVRTKED